MFNANKSVWNLDIEAFLWDSTILPCNCQGSHFIGKAQQHIVTGDLWII